MSLVYIRVCLSIRTFRRTSALNNDFSRGHLCHNPPALAGGCLSLAETAKANGIVFLSIPCEVLDGSTQFTYPSATRNFTTIYALVEEYSSDLCKIANYLKKILR